MLEREENDAQIESIWANLQLVAPTNGKALDIFFSLWSETEAFICRYCGLELTKNNNARSCRCNGCGQFTWFTSNTLLHKARHFKAYLAAILFREAGLIISGLAFSHTVGVAPSTGYNIQKKINLAIDSQMPSAASEISARLFRMIIARRTGATPADRHPFAEQELVEEKLRQHFAAQSAAAGEPINETEAEAEAEQKHEPESEPEPEPIDQYERDLRSIRNMLSDEPTTDDTISEKTGIDIGRVGSCLVMLVLNQQASEVSGGRYIRFATQPQAKKEEEKIELADSLALAAVNFIVGVQEYFQFIGRKTTQLYLAGAWCAQDRERWGEGSLLQLCRNHPPITYRELVTYSSPPLLKIMLC